MRLGPHFIPTSSHLLPLHPSAIPKGSSQIVSSGPWQIAISLTETSPLTQGANRKYGLWGRMERGFWSTGLKLPTRHHEKVFRRGVRSKWVNLGSLKRTTKKYQETWEWVTFGHDFEMRRRLSLETVTYIQQEKSRWVWMILLVCFLYFFCLGY